MLSGPLIGHNKRGRHFSCSPEWILIGCIFGQMVDRHKNKVFFEGKDGEWEREGVCSLVKNGGWRNYRVILRTKSEIFHGVTLCQQDGWLAAFQQTNRPKIVQEYSGIWSYVNRVLEVARYYTKSQFFFSIFAYVRSTTVIQ